MCNKLHGFWHHDCHFISDIWTKKVNVSGLDCLIIITVDYINSKQNILIIINKVDNNIHMQVVGSCIVY